MDTPQTYYEDEIDLREIIKTLLGYKWWILAATLLAAVAAYITSTNFVPRQYQSVAVVVINRPEAVVDLNNRPDEGCLTFTQLDDPFEVEDDWEEELEGFEEWEEDDFDDLGVLPSIPKTEDLVSLAQAGDMIALAAGSADGIEMTASVEGEDQIRLTIADTHPERAAQVANAWAQTFTTRLNGDFNVEQYLAQIEHHVEIARQAWSDAEGNLITALSGSQVGVLETRLANAEKALLRSQSDQGVIEAARFLDAQLAAENPDMPLSLNQSITLVSLIQRAASEGVFLVPADMLPEAYSAGQARADLAALMDSIQGGDRTIEAQIESLEDEINAYHIQLNLSEDEIALYTRERDCAFKTYYQRHTQLVETQQLLQSGEPVAEITTQAEVPTAPIGPKPLATAVLAGTVGLMLSIFVVFVAEWWRKEPGDSE